MPFLRAVLATAVFSVSLGVANGVSAAGATLFDWPRLTASLVQAALCTGLTVIGIRALARRTRTSPWSFGLRRSGVASDLRTGAAVVVGCAAVVMAAARAAGLITVTAVDPAALVTFLLTTVVVATGLEALPEELAFRGFAFSALRGRWSTLAAGLATTVLFLASPGLSNVVSSLVEWGLADGPPPSYAVAPAGEDPVVYLIFLVIWSVTLLAARLVTGSIWTGVAAHLLMLIINRLVLSPTSGVVVRLSHPDVVLILPAYVLLAAVVFALLNRRRNRRRHGNRPEPVEVARRV